MKIFNYNITLRGYKLSTYILASILAIILICSFLGIRLIATVI